MLKIAVGVGLGLVVAVIAFLVFILETDELAEQAAKLDSMLNNREAIARLDTVTGVEIARAYRENSLAAEARFEDTPIVLRGTVERVEGDRERATVHFDLESVDLVYQVELLVFSCILAGDATKPAVELSSGEDVLMLGYIKRNPNLHIRPCRVLQGRS